ncbi:MAG: energy-coupling factor transporter transmembrane protein EcfT [Peptococcaceae bacterium]|jgi:energy-coupling factor transport system permease protein|nr:energy-coupling factor transporter transmembrane protein EcfT [Peptococcaceae bacterium]
MLKDITIGQYYPGDSMIHRLDPRSKIIGMLLYMVGLFLVQSLTGYAFVTAYTLILLSLSRIPVKLFIKGVKPLWFILLFTMGMHFFMTRGGAVLWEWRFLQITETGVQQGLLMAARLIFLISVTSLLTLTTTPIVLTDGLEYLMKAVFIPLAHELAMMMTIALRFIPTLIEETDKIMKAQMARGAEFDSGNLIRKAKSLIPLLVPLFLSAFRRADELAMAMEARCYRGGQNRTRLRALRMGGMDVAALILSAAFLAVCVYYG